MNDSSTGKDPKCNSSLRKIVVVASITTGIQFNWALQLSLMTPYVQLLGIPHAWASLIWLCGPISGMLVQPIVGHHSDGCTSRFGRRRPFIAAGTAAVAVAVFLISFAADIGHLSGDEIGKAPRTRAIAIFVVGFWILDVANNMLQVSCRALLGDLAGSDQQSTRTAYALHTFFMSIGYILGYAAGSYSHLHEILPFTITKACDVDCANLKTCFFIAILLLSIFSVIALTYVKEKQWSKSALMPYTNEIWIAVKNIRRPMWILLMVTSLNATGFFPYMLYSTDWMALEVYGGDSRGSAREVELYKRGVHVGALGLMLGSVVLGFTSLGIEMVARRLGKVKRLWSMANFVLATCLASTVLITKLAESNRVYSDVNDINFTTPSPLSGGIKAAALALFAIIGIPQAALSSIPYALASMFSNNSGLGQGLSVGFVTFSNAMPQMVVSLTSGPLDALFGGGNLPAFVMGAIAATIAGILALTVLPSPPPPDVPDQADVVSFH